MKSTNSFPLFLTLLVLFCAGCYRGITKIELQTRYDHLKKNYSLVQSSEDQLKIKEYITTAEQYFQADNLGMVDEYLAKAENIIKVYQTAETQSQSLGTDFKKWYETLKYNFPIVTSTADQQTIKELARQAETAWNAGDSERAREKLDAIQKIESRYMKQLKDKFDNLTDKKSDLQKLPALSGIDKQLEKIASAIQKEDFIIAERLLAEIEIRLKNSGIFLSTHDSSAPDQTSVQRLYKPRAGDPLPDSIQNSLQPLKIELYQAMQQRDEKLVYTVVDKVKEALGLFAGVPESREIFAKADFAIPPSVEKFVDLWHELYNAGLNDFGYKSEQARQDKMILRESGFIASGCLAFHEAGFDDDNVCLTRAKSELDFLVEKQVENGLFPFPDRRGIDPHFGPMIEKSLKSHPELIQDGWIVKFPDGGGQFDTGVCGVALLEGYHITGERKYLDAGLKAADWAVKTEFATNWNYNSFSAWLLAKAFSLTNDRKYLDAAVMKLKIGVLPGQMNNGIWVDPHNAKQSYHWIMVRGINEVYKNLPENHPDRQKIKDALYLAVDVRAHDLNHRGIANLESITSVLSQVLESTEEQNPEWIRSLNALANLILNEKPKISPDVLGHYIRYRTNADNQKTK